MDNKGDSSCGILVLVGTGFTSEALKTNFKLLWIVPFFYTWLMQFLLVS